MIRLENLIKTYPMGKRQLTVLKGITLDIKQGEMVTTMKGHAVIVHTETFMHCFFFEAPESQYELYKPVSDISLRTWAVKTGGVGSVG